MYIIAHHNLYKSIKSYDHCEYKNPNTDIWKCKGQKYNHTYHGDIQIHMPDRFKGEKINGSKLGLSQSLTMVLSILPFPEGAKP